MDDCIFCKIIKGDIPSRKVYEDEDTLAFYDLNPQTKVHALVISKHHTKNLNEEALLSDHELAACLRTVAKVAKITGIDQTGYRVITNTGSDACQSVGHMHFHVLGGEKMLERMA